MLLKINHQVGNIYIYIYIYMKHTVISRLVKECFFHMTLWLNRTRKRTFARWRSHRRNCQFMGSNSNVKLTQFAGAEQDL